MKVSALDPNAERILRTRNNVAAIREAITRLELAHRNTDNHTTARELGDCLNIARRAFRLELADLRIYAPELAADMDPAQPAPTRFSLTELGKALMGRGEDPHTQGSTE